ncbi:MAG TPA: hypothetical protein VHG51_17475, partial [Longimicrobiaceae bacterium]|nr:hypothetical protein [Longimicrobiaceae bacterium]
MRTPTLLPLALLALAAGPPAAAQGTAIYDSGGPLRPEQAAFDVEFYALELRVDPAARSIAGTGTTVARVVSPTRHLVLDLDTTFAVSAVTAPEGGPLRWERRGGRLWIDLGGVRA